MNVYPAFLLFLFGHVLGDFYFQNEKMAKRKNEKLSLLVMHGAIYALVMAFLLFGIFQYQSNLLWIWITVSGSHILIDFSKKYVKLKRIFTIDQITHVLVLSVAWFLWGRGLSLNSYAENISQSIPVDIPLIILGLLIILRPISMLIESNDIWDFGESRKSSVMIGYLERIIVFFLLFTGQFAAIAFVIAAKTAARFPEITAGNAENSENKLKSEYYLIGTLLSMTSVFLVAYLLGLIGF